MPLFKPNRLPACWRDMRRRPSSFRMQWHVLDGVRGVAALLVMALHDGLIARGGHYGVLIFFTLSGFLLVQPFCKPDYKLSIVGMTEFLLRRILRILPLYLFVIATFGWHRAHFDTTWLIKHATFEWSNGILWTIRQELFFYCLFPFIITGMFLFPAKGLWRTAYLSALSILAGIYVNTDTLLLTGWELNHQRDVPFFLDIFIAGMAGGVLLHTSYAQKLRHIKHQRLAAELIILLLIIAMEVLFRLYPWDDLRNWTCFESMRYGGFVLSLLLCCLVLFPHSFLKSFLSVSLFRAVGIVGYSYYLMHPYGLDFSQYLGRSNLLIVANPYLLTYAMSCIAYCLIEKPHMEMLDRIRKRQAKESIKRPWLVHQAKEVGFY